ncbi:thymidine kinase [Flaviflexus huanghaiensis]|uniref:thymidine kinase n=1 Tax=Flaviflexus huanghaiensis TaxID=1111473 RepID=UPI0015FC07C4|nr:thymidine kinase [Flaviflexus huanghaiensis]
MSPGHLHVITGPMFAGKTAALIAEIRRLTELGASPDIITHAIDHRGRIGDISTHDGATHDARVVATADDIIRTVTSDVVAIDEAQFFGQPLVPAVAHLLDTGRRVIVAGLCVTFDGRPFDPIPELMAVADRVDKLMARCDVCGAPAPYHRPTQTGLGDALDITPDQVGGSDTYQALCRHHVGI